MAILSEEGNEYEVRIQRNRDYTYFEEYVKVGDRERLGALSCERYIVGEPGTSYRIKVIVKKGFKWGNYEAVEAQFGFPGNDDPFASVTLDRQPHSKNRLDEDASIYIDCVNTKLNGAKIFGGTLSFRSLQIGTQYMLG